VRGRAARMGLAEASVKLAAETNLRDIVDGLKREHFDLVVIDSIQTMWSDMHEAGPARSPSARGGGRVGAPGQEARRVGDPGGPCDKDGAIAGPRVVEHMVDAVLWFEGERGYPFRILRAAKNRFGAADEIGVFEMSDLGLREVVNPSALFLNDGGPRSAGLRCSPG